MLSISAAASIVLIHFSSKLPLFRIILCCIYISYTKDYASARKNIHFTYFHKTATKKEELPKSCGFRSSLVHVIRFCRCLPYFFSLMVTVFVVT